MKLNEICQIPQITSKLFTIVQLRGKQPTKLLYSPTLGLFWYYKNDVPQILKNGMDYKFSCLKNNIDYCQIMELDTSDPDIINWKDISYSLEYVTSHFTMREIPKQSSINLYNTTPGVQVVFANGEIGTIVGYSREGGLDTSVISSNVKRVVVELHNKNKCPNNNSNGWVWQNLIDGKHSGKETTHHEWTIVAVLGIMKV